MNYEIVGTSKITSGREVVYVESRLYYPHRRTVTFNTGRAVYLEMPYLLATVYGYDYPDLYLAMTDGPINSDSKLTCFPLARSFGPICLGGSCRNLSELMNRFWQTTFSALSGGITSHQWQQMGWEKLVKRCASFPNWQADAAKYLEGFNIMVPDVPDAPKKTRKRK